MDPIEIRNTIEKLGAGTTAEVADTTGTGDHFSARVISERFKGLNTVKRHQLVYSTLKVELDSGRLHALQLKTITPEERDNSNE